MDYKKLSKIVDIAILSKDSTGLNNAVFVSPAYPRHNPRIKVFKDSPKGECISLQIESPHKITPKGSKLIPEKDLSLVKEWVELNREVLLDYWNGNILYTNELLNKLKSL